MLKSTTVLILFFFLFAASAAWAQQGIPERIGANIDRAPSLQALENKAKKSYNDGDYYTAIQYYQRILGVDSFHIGALEGLGAAALAYTRYDLAASAYLTLIDQNLVDADGAVLVQLADTRYRMMRYADARQLYHLADSLSANAAVKGSARTGMANCDWAIQVQKDTGSVALDSLRDYVNTQFSEYASVWTGDTLYYASYSQPYKNDSTRLLIKTMTAHPLADGSLDIQPVSLNEKKRHTGYVTFNRDKSVVYYAQGKYVEGKTIRFELYRRKRNGDGTWGNAQKLPKQINAKGATTTQPNLCVLPGDQAETLFFVSDRPGGKGRKDIWFSRIQNDTFSNPVNLTALNTDGDDVTPYFHAATGTLYFSSTGRQGLGGFDIYRSDRTADGGWSKPEHLPAPLNSNANDVFYSLSENGRIAFFSSNRDGAKNFSEEDCCYDIFKSGQDKPEIKITACNEETGDTLNYTEMRLLEITPDGMVERSKVTVPGSTHPFPLLPGKSYAIITSKTGFTPDTFYFDTPQKIWDQELAARRCLKPARVNLLVSVVDGDSLRPLPGATVLFRDLSFLQPSGDIETGPDGSPLAELKRDDKDSSMYNFGLLFQHTYAVAASKEGFTSDSSDISTIGLQGDTTIRRELKLRRGLNLDAYVFDDIKKDPLNDVVIRLIELDSVKNPIREWTYPTGPNNNDYHTVINYDSRYRIVATKEKYSKDSLEFRTDDLEKIPFQRIRKELFLRPLELTAYLPITLYFDNDEPEKRTWATTTKKEYRETYVPYYSRKQEFIDNYSAGLTGSELTGAQFELDTFFERRVRGEWNRMRMFSEVLYEMLLNGDQINIRISGFASPLASSDYNKNLTSRRVSSIMNHFSIFDGGIYEPFIQSGQLKLIRVPNGDSKAPKTVNDDPKKRRLSVFSVSASKERRVEIVGVDINGDEILISYPQK